VFFFYYYYHLFSTISPKTKKTKHFCFLFLGKENKKKKTQINIQEQNPMTTRSIQNPQKPLGREGGARNPITYKPQGFSIRQFPAHFKSTMGDLGRKVDPGTMTFGFLEQLSRMMASTAHEELVK
jgi:hypothetical protein